MTKKNFFKYAVLTFLAVVVLNVVGLTIYYKTPKSLEYYEKRYDKVELLDMSKMSYLTTKDYCYYVTFLYADSVYRFDMWLHSFELPTYLVENKQDFIKIKELYFAKDRVGLVKWQEMLDADKYLLLNDSLIVRAK